MDSVQTLHDFALNLLNDPTALAAFGTDPQGVLAAAGLGDVSAADVHEVIPLVLDYVPVDSLPAVGGLPVVGDLSAVGTDATGIQGAIDQLTALTAGLGLPATSDLPVVGDLGGELPGVGGLGLPAVGDLGHTVTTVTDVTNTAAGVTALAGDVTGSLGLGNDLAQSIDAGALGNLGSAVTGAVESGNVVGQADQVVTGVTGHVAAPVHAGDLTGAVTGAVTGATDVTNHVGDFTGTLKNVGDLDLKHVGGELTNTVQHSIGDITHNTVTTVTGAAGVDHNSVGDIASNNGVDAVHDVVSGVTDNLSHNALGNIHVGDLGHNDIHLGH
ncbi:IniB N-terminal domain-containing protein [Amycolatopsis sp. CA-128772]|uniref:IniB N-terminal domain-containing protein n=1 Tax=Amycolatopsis sp. CA-128772 TaxID=2073159 RepID=UPI000CD1E254|nr:IniB N-terminal domain-containing protein [Amycolatopsis sp. CA-128772]